MAISTCRSSSQALCSFDLVLDLGLLVEQLFHFVGLERLAQPGVDLVEAAEDLADRLDGFFDVAENVTVGIELRLLRQIAGREAGEERASPSNSWSMPAMIRSSVLLPEPLLAQHADLGARIERQMDVLQDFPLTEFFGQAGDLIDELCTHDSIPIQSWRAVSN